ncbi:terpene synthase family protein [Nocardia sp. CWNU-33]|uniref:terpene synthase family protein n=1 Tax=Nocardia sp. CWNU-33 TaxID=3392117 RepID=UPI00398E9632
MALPSPYPLRISSHYPELRARWTDWYLAAGPFETDAAKRKVVSADYAFLGAAAWPVEDWQRLWDITTLAATIIEFDDEFDDNRTGYGDVRLRRRRIADLADDFGSGFAGSTDQRWTPLLAGSWRNMLTYTGPGVLKRLAEECVRYVQGCRDVDDYLAEHGEFTDIQTYTDLRFYSLGQRIDHMFVEVSRGIDLTQVIEEPALVAIIDSEVRRTIISQDFLSLYKDLGIGGDQLENLIVLVARTRNCSLRAAMSICMDMFAAENLRFDSLTADIAETPLGRLPEVRAFIQGLADFTAGYMHWTTGSGRYTSSDTCTWWD